MNSNVSKFKNSDLVVNRSIPSKFQVNTDNETIHGYIYCIENKINGMKYIGSTYSIWTGIQNPRAITALNKRASHYVYEYNKTLKNRQTTSSKRILRPIIQAMIDDGIENFIMYPIAETTKSTHTDLENYFIEFFDTIKLGYNCNKAGPCENKNPRRKMSNNGKLIRSTGIISINMNNKQLIFSDSMKLFADYIGSSKDMIKNTNRNARPYKGWFVFYLDKDKRSQILSKVLDDSQNRKQERYSDNHKNFYYNLFNTIELYLNDLSTDEYFPEFERLPNLVYKED